MKLHFNACKSVLFFLVLALFTVSCKQPQKIDYSKNLEIVSDINVYNKLILEKPKNTLVDLEKFIPGIKLDIRYAGTNNFTNEQIYLSPKAFLRKPAVEALLKISEELKSEGIGLKIFDAYRPYDATVKFYEVYPDTNFVAAPWKGSVHNRGCAVDLTLIDLATNIELEMPTPFDDFSSKAAQSFMDLPESSIKNRTLLKNIMAKYGFQEYEQEWWHYNFNDWEKFQLMNIPFEELK